MSISTIDLDALRKLRDVIGGGSDDLAELIDDFVSDTPSLLSKMRMAQAEQNWHDMRLAAHTLKSNARDLGASVLLPLCAGLEQECKDGVPLNVDAKLNAIETALGAARDSLMRINVTDV